MQAQPFSIQKNKDLHTSSLFTSLSLREQNPNQSNIGKQTNRKPQNHNLMKNKKPLNPPQKQIKLPTDQNKTTVIPT